MKNLKKVTSIISAMAIMFVATTAFAMSTGEFDRGLSKGIDYFNKGLYYEARDEFQWFCDANWGKMNEGQRKYALDYLDGAKQKIKEIEGSAKVLSQSEFDKGMSKGIEYFNKGMYYEARDEFQWFCNAKWGKMNKAQQQYALDYLGGAKEKIKEWENKQKNSEKQSTKVTYTTADKEKMYNQIKAKAKYGLKSPSTAIWPPLSDVLFLGGPNSNTDIIMVLGDVEAMNGFGGYGKVTFEAKFTYDCKIIDCVFVE